MTDAQAEPVSEAARTLAAKRWGSTVVRRAAATLAERRAELDEALRAELREIADDPDGDAA